MAIVSKPSGATGALLLEDGEIHWGHGVGRKGRMIGELCFNTAQTGYQEILTDPSYCEQIIVFTFPHIGVTGATDEDRESVRPVAHGLVMREAPRAPSSWRAQQGFADWLGENALVGLSGIDTRSLTRRLREGGAIRACIAHFEENSSDYEQLLAEIRAWPGIERAELTHNVTGRWPVSWPGCIQGACNHVVVIDYGAKGSIPSLLAQRRSRVSIAPAHFKAEQILALRPDGVVLSNGPGDPAASSAFAVPVIRRLLAENLPLFGVCLGHQLLCLAVGGRTRKMHHGHHGANHPVRALATGHIEITSQNHGFDVDPASLPDDVRVSHVSLFDGTIEGVVFSDRVFSVQYHPEASPGPHDSAYLFDQFITAMDRREPAGRAAAGGG